MTIQNRKTLHEEIGSALDDLIDISRDLYAKREFVLLHWDEREIGEVASDLRRITTLSDMLLGVVKESSRLFEFASEDEEPFDINGPPKSIGHPIADEVWAQMPDEWTPVDLAKAARVQQKTIDLLLSGTTRKPHAKTLRKIEQALGLEEGHLDE